MAVYRQRLRSSVINSLILAETINSKVSADTVNGLVSSEKVNELVTAKTVNDNVSSAKVNELVTADTVNGHVTGEKVNELVTAKTVNDNVSSDRVNELVTAKTVNDNVSSDRVNELVDFDGVFDVERLTDLWSGNASQVVIGRTGLMLVEIAVSGGLGSAWCMIYVKSNEPFITSYGTGGSNNATVYGVKTGDDFQLGVNNSSWKIKTVVRVG